MRKQLRKANFFKGLFAVVICKIIGTDGYLYILIYFVQISISDFLNEPQYTKRIQVTTVEPFKYEVRNVAESVITFLDFFEVRFNGGLDNPGMYVDMKAGLDRDVSQCDVYLISGTTTKRSQFSHLVCILSCNRPKWVECCKF